MPATEERVPDPLQVALARWLKPERGPAPRLGGPRPPRGARAPSWLIALVAPLTLLASLGAILIVRAAPAILFPLAITFAAVVVFGWIAVSSLLPSRAERTCPACGADALERLDRQSHRGLRCASCRFVDREASSFYLAEEEGPLERTVIAERRRARSRGSR